MRGVVIGLATVVMGFTLAIGDAPAAQAEQTPGCHAAPATTEPVLAL